MYKTIKRLKGVPFAQAIRHYHNGIFEIPDLDKIVLHAGHEAEPLFSYLMSLLQRDAAPKPSVGISDPFNLLAQAGYDAFYADTQAKQDSIKPLFEPNEELCTFGTPRYESNHIVHAIKKCADALKRSDFKGKESREDAYGASVISIQMKKDVGFIKITNRYNHTVANPDHTFHSNPDNIIDGLSSALQAHFNVDFTVTDKSLPEEYRLVDKQLFKYHSEINNVFYGDQAWIDNGTIYAVNKSAGDALFERFLFDNKTKTFKLLEPNDVDSFVDDFNRVYGGNPDLCVKNGNLTLNGTVLIGAEHSRIKTLYLPDMTSMGDNFLIFASELTHAILPALKTMGNSCFKYVEKLIRAEFPVLTAMGIECFNFAHALTHALFPALKSMGDFCFNSFNSVNKLTHIDFRSLKKMGNYCFYFVQKLKRAEFNSLESMGHDCFYNLRDTTYTIFPALKNMGRYCFHETPRKMKVKIKNIARRNLLMQKLRLF